ncbi:hypothetical protein [Burkholderia gladioli]|uniref:hypothetical protein n=1 Tax=Burkholderia gladioli TaxID=28095 RepID=UPI001C2305CD|nr:hypothetical protein [Burkholderia gladioli]MBU9267522.1 hypothetical protein [Burkholderia gladioli]
MQPTREQAAQALQEIEAVGGHSRRLHRYAHTAPILTLWGWIWLLGFGLGESWPGVAGLAWIPLNLAGIAGSLYLARRGRAARTAATTWRWLSSILAILAFYLAVLALFPTASARQSAALIALIVALAYGLAGLWFGARFAVAGAALAALTLGGYLLLPAHFMLWMALLGGGALMLAGTWLRKV